MCVGACVLACLVVQVSLVVTAAIQVAVANTSLQECSDEAVRAALLLFGALGLSLNRKAADLVASMQAGGGGGGAAGAGAGAGAGGDAAGAGAGAGAGGAAGAYKAPTFANVEALGVQLKHRPAMKRAADRLAAYFSIGRLVPVSCMGCMSYELHELHGLHELHELQRV